MEKETSTKGRVIAEMLSHLTNDFAIAAVSSDSRQVSVYCLL